MPVHSIIAVRRYGGGRSKPLVTASVFAFAGIMSSELGRGVAPITDRRPGPTVRLLSMHDRSRLDSSMFLKIRFVELAITCDGSVAALRYGNRTWLPSLSAVISARDRIMPMAMPSG